MNVDTMNEKVKELRELRRMQEELAGMIAPAFSFTRRRSTDGV